MSQTEIWPGREVIIEQKNVPTHVGTSRKFFILLLYHEGKFCSHSDFSVNLCNSLSASDGTLLGYDLTFHLKNVTGDDLLLEARILDTSEECDLTLVLLLREDGDGTDLGKRLDDQYAGHHMLLGKMTEELHLIDGYTFDAFGPLSGLEIKNTIYKLERISVRDDLPDLIRIKFHTCLLTR